MKSPAAGGEGIPDAARPARVEFRDAPQERNAQFAQAVAKLIAEDLRFSGQVVSIEFPQTGATSFVCFLESAEGKMVFKLPSKPGYHAGEMRAFAAWKKQGVSVPDIIEDGMLEVVENGAHKSRPYVIMSYIGERALNDGRTKEELLAADDYARMGALQRHMHTTDPDERGFGLIRPDGDVEFSSFDEWMGSEKMQTHINYVVEHGLLDAGVIEKARAILVEHANANPRTTYCHMDFSAQNIFKTEPLTVFDPGTELNVPLVDLGKAVVCNVMDGEEAIAQLIEGYEAGGESVEPMRIDRRALHAAVVITALRKLVFLHKNADKETPAARIKALQAYFAAHESLLED